MRQRVLVAAGVAVALVAIALGGAAVSGPSAPGSAVEELPPAERLVQPDGTDSALWPYTSRRRSADGRTLALNVVVHGKPEQIQRLFTDRTDANWTEGEGDDSVAPSLWQDTTGAARYSYVAPSPNATGQWVVADYQLDVGTYFGERIHVRAYPSMGGNWTALQAHTEYWDWFRLRHTVTGLEPAAAFVERDLGQQRVVTGVHRQHHDFEGGRSPGWLTVVVLGTLGVWVGSVTALSRRQLRVLALPAAMAGIVLGVRAGGLLVEGLVPGLPPNALAALGFPVLALGPLVAIRQLAVDRRPIPAAVATAVGLGGALLVDLAAIGVVVVPPRLLYHRFALAGALALVALGVAADDRRVAVAGVFAWLLALGGMLFGLL